MTVRGVSRLLARTVTDWLRGVALCARDAAEQVKDDVAAMVNLSGAIRDAFTQSDDLLAGYEAHATPYEDVTGRDNLGWR